MASTSTDPELSTVWSPAEMTSYDASEVSEQSLDDGAAEREPPYVCANCGAAVEPSEWHPVATRPDGSPSVFLFCRRACRTAWLDEEARR